MTDARGRAGALRGALRWAFGKIARIYFRDIEVAGEVPSPDTGGRLFGANHVNALVDPILVLTQAPCAISPVAKSTLFRIPGLRWLLDVADAVPIVRRRDDPTKAAGDNDAVFARVAEHLSTHGNVLIFPEGTSHNEPRLLALRSGAGRMLARARASGGDRLTFQAVALEFDQRDVFRSRCLVLFGPVRSVEDVARRGGREAPEDELAPRITEVLREDLSSLLVEAESWEARLRLVRVAEMFANEAESSLLAERTALGRRVERARAALRSADPATVSSLESEVDAYFAELDAMGIADREVARLARRRDESLARDAKAASVAATELLALPLALAGMVLYWPPYQVPRLVTRQLGSEADVASTYKLGVGLAVFPLWAAVLVACALLVLPAPLALAAAGVALVSPFAALPWLDRLDRVASRTAFLAPREIRRERLSALVERRLALRHALEGARARVEATAVEGVGTTAPRAGVL